MSEHEGPRPLVLDTSVAVKFYLPEDLRDEALALLAAVGDAIPDLLAPSTIQPEFFNALWQQHRRNKLTRDEVRRFWGEFVADDPASLYAPEDLMPRAAEVALDSGVIVYDALFLALAEGAAFVAVKKPDGFSMKVLSPYIKDEGDKDWDVNDVSLVLNLEVMGLNILFPGDSSAKTWQERIIPYTLSKEEMEYWAKAEILVASHHGSYSFFGEDRDAVREADPYPDNYESLGKIEPDLLLVSAAKRFPTSRDQSGDLPPQYAAYKWYHRWFREERGVSEEDKHPDQFKYTADGHLRLEYGDDGWEWIDDWSPDDDGGGDGGGKGFRYRPGPTRRAGSEYA